MWVSIHFSNITKTVWRLMQFPLKLFKYAFSSIYLTYTWTDVYKSSMLVVYNLLLLFNYDKTKTNIFLGWACQHKAWNICMKNINDGVECKVLVRWKWTILNKYKNLKYIVFTILLVTTVVSNLPCLNCLEKSEILPTRLVS